jgi:hypothetical protein
MASITVEAWTTFNTFIDLVCSFCTILHKTNSPSDHVSGRCHGGLTDAMADRHMPWVILTVFLMFSKLLKELNVCIIN